MFPACLWRKERNEKFQFDASCNYVMLYGNVKRIFKSLATHMVRNNFLQDNILCRLLDYCFISPRFRDVHVMVINVTGVSNKILAQDNSQEEVLTKKRACVPN